MELIRILTAHARRYPLMQPADAVKLIYQNEFGGGHLITDPAASLERLRAECAATPADPSAPLTEEIGNGWVRVSLAALEGANYTVEALNRDFVRSAEGFSGSRASFLDKLETLKALASMVFLPFSAGELDSYLTGYLAAGCPPVSHSPRFRDAYRPAYRVVRRDCLSAPTPPADPPGLPLETIARLLAEEFSRRKSPLVAAIDGRCASGKTTLASLLRQNCGCAVLHIDDFFLRPEQRTPERLAQPGGNVDYERVLSEVLLPLRQGKPAVYRPFDCHLWALGPEVRVGPAPITVVEGSYSCHPALRGQFDLRVFLSVPPEEQARRLLEREGPEGFQTFRARWVPLEERYIAFCGPDQDCDFQFNSV